MMSEEQCIRLCHKRLQPKLEDRCYSQWHAKKKMGTLEEASCEKNLILLLATVSVTYLAIVLLVQGEFLVR